VVSTCNDVAAKAKVWCEEVEQGNCLVRGACFDVLGVASKVSAIAEVVSDSVDFDHFCCPFSSV